MPNIPKIQIGGTEYFIKDEEARKLFTSPIANYLLQQYLIGDNVECFDPTASGLTYTLVPNTAWRIDLNHTSGSNYQYLRIDGIPSNYYGGMVVAWGHSWGSNWPMILFYNSSNKLISVVGEKGDTRCRRLTAIIPNGTSYIVVNGSPNDSYETKVRFAAYNDFLIQVKSALRSFGSVINQSIITSNPDYSDVRNLPCNRVYTLVDNVYPSLTNIPKCLDTYATLIKVNPSISGGVDDISYGYAAYILINQKAVWMAFDTASSGNYKLQWHHISGERGRRYLFIGDSYGDGYSHDGNNSGWGEYLAECMGLGSNKYLNKHHGGDGFANGGFKTLLESVSSDYFSDIVVLGGFNDRAATRQQILDGINTFCATARSLFAGAKVHIGCVGWIKEGTDPSSAYSNWEEVRQNIIETVIPAYQSAPKFGAGYISMSEYILTDDMMTNKDGYHPGEEGNKAIAKAVANALLTGAIVLPFNPELKH